MRYTITIIALLLVAISCLAIYRTDDQIENKVLDATNNAKRVILAGGDSTQTDSLEVIALRLQYLVDSLSAQYNELLVQGDSIDAITVDIDDIRIEQALQGDSLDVTALRLQYLVDSLSAQYNELLAQGDSLDVIAVYSKGIWDSLAAANVVQGQMADSIYSMTLDIDSLLRTWEGLEVRWQSDTMENESLIDTTYTGTSADTVTSNSFATNFHSDYSLFFDIEDLDEGTDSVDYQIEALYSLDDVEFTAGDSVGYITAETSWDIIDLALLPAPYVALSLIPSSDTGDSVRVNRIYVVKHD